MVFSVVMYGALVSVSVYGALEVVVILLLFFLNTLGSKDPEG